MARVNWYFLDLPVYRCIERAHAAEMAAARAKRQEPLRQHFAENSDAFRRAGTAFDLREWYAWRFNEVVGFVRLYILGSQVRGELWWRRGARLSARPRQPFEQRETIFEHEVEPSDSSERIFKGLVEELATAARDRPLKGRFLDCEVLERMGPFVDWRAAVHG